MSSFDFVIVGAGSAGCVLADHLSRDGRHSVAVIEAGGSDRRLFVQMPLGYGKTFYDPAINWMYRAEPDAGLGGNADYWPRGKLLGGSGSINAMVWIRGHARDYDGWAAEGNPGWAFADCLPHFKALEDAEAGDPAWRGRGGPVHVSDLSTRLHPLAKAFLTAGTQAGFPRTSDFNGAEQDGFGVYQTNTRAGWRQSPATAFLRPALARGTVSLMTHRRALRLSLDGRRVTGVVVDWPGRGEVTIRARREVILTAGAVNTPQLLQLSGIGPQSLLCSLGVPVVCDAPAIGHHLQDHVGLNYTYRARIPSLNEALRPWWGKLRAGAEFLLRGTGPLSMSLNQGGAFVRTRAGLDRPNIQLYLQAISTVTARGGTRPLLTPDPFPGFNLGFSNCAATSRGSILIRSPDPRVAPAIRPNAYGTEADLLDALEGVKLIRRLAAQPALAAVIAEELAPGPGVQHDAALIADIRARSGTVYHPCGTVRMGPDPARAGVDARLRLHGMAGLRVADASVFPSVICGNINWPVMMVASKAAAMILEDARG